MKNTRQKQFLVVLLFFFLFSQIRNSLGDVNNDDNLDILDIVRIANIILGNDSPPSEYEMWAADVNVDEEINIQDIIILVSVITGTICPDYQYPCSDNLSFCCPDSTNRFTTYEIDTFGIYFSSLVDVAVVDDNDIWAVDKINMPVEDQNAVHWNGEEWELLRITVPPYYGFSELTSILAIAEDDIWAGKNVPYHYNSIEWRGYYPEDGWEDSWNFDGFISAIWGSSSDDVYFLGNNGAIAHYDGETFTYIPYDTEIDLRDIHGTPDGEHVFIVGWQLTWPGSSLVLELQNGVWNEIYYAGEPFPSDSSYGLASAVSVYGDTAYISTYSGLLKYNYLETTSTFIPSENFEDHQGLFRDLVVQTPLDILQFSGIPVYIHYNGVSWDLNNDVNQYFGDGGSYVLGGDMKGDMLVSVGYCYGGSQAVVVRGYREPAITSPVFNLSGDN